ncbi:MAG: guanylate kinase [Lachnospiraceae bacterium]|nr:guanylate kinase [Lachnospiraceae bacterium]
MSLYCICGKSASGKDSIYRRLMADEGLGFGSVVSYTTRPRRDGETEGKEYHFSDLEGLEAFRASGKLIEERVYHTVHGDWHYFTVDDGSIDPGKDYLLISTPEGIRALKAYFGDEAVKGLYIELDDGERLQRAVSRERQQAEPKYAELCRRFLADEKDFSEQELEKAGIEARFVNDELETCVRRIRSYIANA